MAIKMEINKKLDRQEVETWIEDKTPELPMDLKPVIMIITLGELHIKEVEKKMI